MQAIQNKNDFFILNGIKIYKDSIVNLSELTIESAIALAENCESKKIKIYNKYQAKAISVFGSLLKRLDHYTLKIAKVLIDTLIGRLFDIIDKVNEKIESMEGKNFEKQFSETELFTMFLQYPNKQDERLVSIRSYYRFLTKRQANYVREILVDSNKKLKKSQ